MKNFLIFEDSWARISTYLAPNDQLQPVLFRRDGSLSVNGQATDSVPIHAGWINFDVGFERAANLISVLVQADELEFVQTSAAGLDSDFFKGLVDKPIRFCNSDAAAPAIVEYVMASILNRLQRFDVRSERQRSHSWVPHEFRELGGCHCLLVGYGAIGSRIADRLRGFGSKVTVVRRRPGKLPGVHRVGALRDLPELLPGADIVILATALNDDTRDLFDDAMCARFKNGAILVNVARGAVVNEASLLDVLNAGRLDYAVLDVFREEPLTEDHPLWDHERVLVTAHTSSTGSDLQARDDRLLVENLENYLAHRPLRNEVDLASIR